MSLYACPVCHGQGTVSRPPYVAGDQPTWVANSVGPYVCKPCGGQGVIGRHDDTERPVSTLDLPLTLRAEILRALAAADGQATEGFDWGHTAEIMYGKQASAVLRTLRHELRQRVDEIEGDGIRVAGPVDKNRIWLHQPAHILDWIDALVEEGPR